TDEVGKIDLSTARPWTSLSRHDDQFLVKQKLDVQVAGEMPLGERAHSCEDKIEAAIAQLGYLRTPRHHSIHAEAHARIPLRKLFDDRRQDRRRKGFGTPNAHLAASRIS